MTGPQEAAVARGALAFTEDQVGASVLGTLVGSLTKRANREEEAQQKLRMWVFLSVLAYFLFTHD